MKTDKMQYPTISKTPVAVTDANASGDNTDYAAVPPELRARRIWLPFRTKPRRSGGFAKIPHGINCRGARYTDPASWMDFDTALRMVKNPSYRMSGLGLVLSSGLAGYDADHCIGNGGDLPDEIWTHLRLLDSYTELSYSGTGVHCLFFGKLPPVGRRRGNVEMYDSARYFVVTGRHLAGTPRRVEERQPECEALHALIWSGGGSTKARSEPHPAPASGPVTQSGANSLKKRKSEGVKGELGLTAGGPGCEEGDCPVPPPGGDPELPQISGARAKAVLLRDPVAKRYWNAQLEGKRNASNDDFALACKLAFYCRCDIAQMDRLFRQSGLFRPTKWDRRFTKADKRLTTYGRHTLEKACREQNGIVWRPRPKPIPIRPPKRGRPVKASTQAVVALLSSAPQLKSAEVAAIHKLKPGTVRKIWSRYRPSSGRSVPVNHVA